MDFASPLSDLVKYLWGLASTPLGYIYNLKDNVDLLRMEIEHLNAKSEDVEARVKREEEGGDVRRTREVVNWLKKVQIFLGGVDRVLREARERDQIKCLGHCLPRNCWSGYQLGKAVNQMLNEARELKKEGFNTMLPLPSPPVLVMPMDETVGLDISFNKVWKWLVDENEIRVIGLYGRGGVGKTTLMKRINNDLSCANHGFKVVIWVTMSRQVNEDKIRDTIRRGLHIKDEIWEQWSRNGANHNHLSEVLTQKKFVLLIDDVWARLDLSEIGVPRSCLENGSKVVFTTRSKTVCHQMRADKAYEVQGLTPEEALGLFMDNVGKSTVHSNPQLLELAKHFVLECKGLPLALITVGRAMAGVNNIHLWRESLRKLRNRPHEPSGMVDEVYQFSYDKLKDATRRACFLYCCCFPKDYPIMSDKLIELWIGEGLLGDIDDVYHMRDKGASILGDLKRACLLESGPHKYVKPTVKMHDVIHDMATWIAHDHGQKENKLLVIENEEDISAEMISKWGEAEKVSIWGSLIANVNQTPPMCSRLETLFVRKTKVRLLARGFFESMTACLKVLDLSDNENIESFPEGICDLINLRYLNLSGTQISKLPKEVKNLTRLRWLLLDNIELDILIPTGAIASLPLNVFSKWGCALEKEEEVVQELEDMQDLTDLSIKVQTSFSVLKMFQSLQRCIRRVEINDCEDLICIPISHSLKGSSNLSHLEVLYLDSCPMLVNMEITQGIGRANYFCFPSLVEVKVDDCGFLDLSWLVHAPKLQELTVARCPSMEKIIGDGFAREELATSELFSRLQILDIDNLPNLRSICDHTLIFPQMVKLSIKRCPSLRKLPWNRTSLDEVKVDDCGFLDLSWLVHALKLQELTVARCPSMEKIIGDGFAREELAASELFSRLQILDIDNLPNLRSICDHTLIFPQMVKLSIKRCPSLRKLPWNRTSLVEVKVDDCGFLDLSWLVHASRLQELTVARCPSMEKIIGDGFAREELATSELFSRLQILDIDNLPNLSSICDHTLIFPQVVKLSIKRCPGLRKLPWNRTTRGEASRTLETQIAGPSSSGTQPIGSLWISGVGVP